MKILESPEALESASRAERLRMVRGLLDRLGPDWRSPADPAALGALRIVHTPTNAEFAVIPGGRFRMGLTEEDVEELSKHVDMHSGIKDSLEFDGGSASPVHDVEVGPFLCERAPQGAGGPRRAVQLSTNALGFRLPSEAELEWVVRDGGRYALTLGAVPIPGKSGRFHFEHSRFGLDRLLVAHWAADDWHDSYEGAPDTSVPWLDGHSDGVCRSTFPLEAMVSEEDVVALLSALRTRGSASIACIGRRVADIPLD